MFFTKDPAALLLVVALAQVNGKSSVAHDRDAMLYRINQGLRAGDCANAGGGFRVTINADWTATIDKMDSDTGRTVVSTQSKNLDLADPKAVAFLDGLLVSAATSYGHPDNVAIRKFQDR